MCFEQEPNNGKRLELSWKPGSKDSHIPEHSFGTFFCLQHSSNPCASFEMYYKIIIGLINCITILKLNMCIKDRLNILSEILLNLLSGLAAEVVSTLSDCVDRLFSSEIVSNLK